MRYDRCTLKVLKCGAGRMKISWADRVNNEATLLLDDLKKARRYWKLKEEAQDRTLWGTQFPRAY
jgi:hypothetical protein